LKTAYRGRPRPVIGATRATGRVRSGSQDGVEAAVTPET
jgi:hypothetical protein